MPATAAGGCAAECARRICRSGSRPYPTSCCSRPTGDLPESLDEALPRVLGSTRVRSGEAFVAGWEVYGLQTGESAIVGITMQDAEPRAA